MTDESPLPVVVRPDVPATVESMNLFQRLKTEALAAEDIIEIQGKKYIKRSGWRKVSLAFNISTEITKVDRVQEGENLVVRVQARARAPNGRVAEEVGVCDSSEFEKGNLKATLHNIESKAATRAINRAISDLVGGGEVSAEEMIQSEEKGAPEPTLGEPARPEGTKFLLVTWTVRGSHETIPDSGPTGFMRKTIAAIEKTHAGAAIAVIELDGAIVDLRIVGLDKPTVEKDILGPLMWTLQRVLDVEKADIEVSIEESSA
jgi:hypothetical protein